MGKQQSKGGSASGAENKIINGLADHAIKNFELPKGVDKARITKELSTNKAYFQEIAKDFYSGKYKGKKDAPSYEEWEKKQLDIYGNPFESKKKDPSTTGSQAGSDIVENGVSEGQNTSKTDNPNPMSREDWKRQNEFLGIGGNPKQKENTQQEGNYDELFMGGTPEGYQPTTQISDKQNQQIMSGKVDAQQQPTRTDKQTVQPTNPTLEKEKAALKENQKNTENLQSNPVKQADYFLGERDGYSVTGNFESDGLQKNAVDTSLNTDPTAPESEQQQIFSKLIGQNNQFLRDSGRGSNVDYNLDKGVQGDISEKDRFKEFQGAYATRMNALSAKAGGMEKDAEFMKKLNSEPVQEVLQAKSKLASMNAEWEKALKEQPEIAKQLGDQYFLQQNPEIANFLKEKARVEQLTKTQINDQQINEYLEVQNQITQLNKLTSDPNFIKTQFGEEVGKEYLEGIAAQAKADKDFAKANSKEGSYLDFYVDSNKNVLKQVGSAVADFLTGVASLPRIIGGANEYGLGDVVADWANEQNENFKATFPEPTQIASPIFKNKVDKDGNAVLDSEGKVVEETNWVALPYKLVRAATDLGLQIAGTKGMGAIKGFNAIKGSSAIGMGAMSFAQTYNQSFQQALAKGESRNNAETFAVTNAFMTAGLESIAPNTWATKGLGFSDNLFASMVKNGFKPNASKAFAKEFIKETGGEITEEISQNINTKMLETSMGIGQFQQKRDSDQTFEQEMKETALITMFLGGGMGIGAGKQKYSQMNNLTKAAAFEIAINPAFTQAKIKEQFELQNIPIEKQQELLQQLDDIKETHEALPNDVRNGMYARNLIDLTKQHQELEEKILNPKLTPVLKEKVQQEIDEVNARITELANRNPTKQSETQNQETESQSETQISPARQEATTKVEQATQTLNDLQSELNNASEDMPDAEYKALQSKYDQTAKTLKDAEKELDTVITQEENATTQTTQQQERNPVVSESDAVSTEKTEQQKASEKQALRESVIGKAKELNKEYDKIITKQSSPFTDIKRTFKSKSAKEKLEQQDDTEAQEAFDKVNAEFDKLTPLNNQLLAIEDYDERMQFLDDNRLEIATEKLDRAKAEKESGIWDKERADKEVANAQEIYDVNLKESETNKKVQALNTQAEVAIQSEIDKREKEKPYTVEEAIQNAQPEIDKIYATFQETHKQDPEKAQNEWRDAYNKIVNAELDKVNKATESNRDIVQRQKDYAAEQIDKMNISQEEKTELKEKSRNYFIKKYNQTENAKNEGSREAINLNVSKMHNALNPNESNAKYLQQDQAAYDEMAAKGVYDKKPTETKVEEQKAEPTQTQTEQPPVSEAKTPVEKSKTQFEKDVEESTKKAREELAQKSKQKEITKLKNKKKELKEKARQLQPSERTSLNEKIEAIDKKLNDFVSLDTKRLLEQPTLSESDIKQLEENKKALDKQIGVAQKAKDYQKQAEIAKQMEAINDKLNPKEDFGNTPREIKINIAAATKRALDEATESETWQKMQNDYEAKRGVLKQLINSKAPQAAIDALQEIVETQQNEMHKQGQELIKSIFERETGLKIESIENSIGRFDGVIEPSHVITFKVKNDTEFAKVEEAAKKFSERTLQDAYIVTQEITDADEKLIQDQLGKTSDDVMVHEVIDFGERGKGRIVTSETFSFDKPLSQQEISDIEDFFVNSVVESFTISNDGKSIQFQYFSFEATKDAVISDLDSQRKTINEFVTKLENDYKRVPRYETSRNVSFYRAANEILDDTARTGKTKSERAKRTYPTSTVRQESSEVGKDKGKNTTAPKENPPPTKDDSKKDSSGAKNDSKRSKNKDENKNRQNPLESEGKIKVGKETDLIFSAEQKPVKAKFGIVESTDLQASNTINGTKNDLHAISAAQPKDWSDDREVKTNDIRDNPRMNDLSGKSSSPFIGTPVINERGEVIQGNGRTIGLQKHYDKNGKNSPYKQFLIDNAEAYGLDPDEVVAMDNPVLVRVAPVSDTEATQLGQALAQDTESGGEGRVSITNAINSINAFQGTNTNPQSATERIAMAMNKEGNEGKSIKQLLGQNDFVKSVLDIFHTAKAITNAVRDTMTTATGGLTQKGKADVEEVLTGIALGRGVVGEDAGVSISDVRKGLEAMPIPIQEAINDSTVELLSTKKGLGQTLHNAFQAYIQYVKGVQSKTYKGFDDFVNQTDINGTTLDRFGKDGINLARFFHENNDNKKVSREGFKQFLADYEKNLQGEQGSLMNPDGIKPMSQQDAATEASAKLLQNNPPAPKNKPKTKEKESRFTSARNTETQSNAVKKMVDRLKKAFPNINVEFDANLKNQQGETIAGVYRDGKVILNPEFMTMEDAIEEHAHLYLELAKVINPTVFNEGKRVIDNSKEGREILEQVKQDYPDKSIDDQYNEAIAKAIAKYGVNVKKPNRVTRFVDKIRKMIGDKLRAMDRKWIDKDGKRTFFSDYFRTTNSLDVGKMNLADFSKVIAGELLNETPLSYVSADMLSEYETKNKPTDKVPNITVERGLMQDPTALDRIINKGKYWVKTGANVPKNVIRSVRNKAARGEASSKDIANNTYIFVNALNDIVNKQFEGSDLTKKEKKAAKSAAATQLFQDANEVLHGNPPSQPLPQALQDIVKVMRDNIDAHTKALIEAGLVPKDDLVGQFNDNLTIFLKRNFDAEQLIRNDVAAGNITQEQADEKMKGMTATSVVPTIHKRKSSDSNVDITIATADGKTHKFTGLNAKDVYYLFGKEAGKKVMNEKVDDTGKIDLDPKPLYSNPLYAVMMANVGKYVNRSYSIHSAKTVQQHLSSLTDQVINDAFDYFAKQMRNPEVSSVTVNKMPPVNGEARYSVTFKNKYGIQNTTNENHANLSLEEVLEIVDGNEQNTTARQEIDELNAQLETLDPALDGDEIIEITATIKELEKNSGGNPRKKTIAKFKDRFADLQTTPNFEFRMPSGFTSDRVGFSVDTPVIQRRVNEFLAGQIAKGGNDGRKASNSPVKKNESITEKRKTEEQLPKVLRDLMGENTDPLTNYANTMMKMANLLHTQEMANDLWREGGDAMFAEKATPTNSKQISADGNSAFAPLDGKFTTPEIYDILMGDSQASGDSYVDKAYSTWLYLNGLAKVSLTVRSMGSNMRNLWGAFKMLASSGSLNPMNLPKAIQIVYENTRPGKHRDFYTRGVELGVFSQNIDSKIIKAQLGRAKNAARQKFDTKRGAWENLKTFSEKVYQFPDDLVKAIGLLTEMDYEHRVAKSEGRTITDDEAMVAAAETIKAVLPNYALTSKAMQALSKNAVVGSFVMFQAETIRNRFNTAGIAWNEITSGNKVRRNKGLVRMGSLIAMGTIAPALALVMKMNIEMEDEEEEGLRAMLRDYEKNNVFLWTGRNEKGEPTYLDLSFIDPDTQVHKIIGAAWRGKGFKNKFQEAITEMYKPFIGMEIFTSDAFKVIDNEDDFGRKVVPKNSKEWGAMKAATTVGANLIPKVSYEALYIAMGVANEFKGEKDEKYQTYTRDIKASEELTNTLLGAKKRTFDAEKRFKSVVYNLSNARNFGNDLLKDKSTLIRNLAVDMSLVGEITEARKIEIAKANYRKEAVKIQTAVKAMKVYGYSNEAIRKIVKGSGKNPIVSGKMIDAILSNNLEYYPFNEDKTTY